MRIIRFLILAFLISSISCAWADIAPRPWWPFSGHRHHGPPFEVLLRQAQAASNVSLDNADVQVRIMRKKPENPASLQGLQIIAKVTGEFDLRCSAKKGVPQGLEVIFPVFYEDGGQSRLLKSSVKVDGKSVANLGPARIPIKDEAGESVKWASGFTWTLPAFKPGQKQRIEVEYSCLLPQSEGKAHFTYILRSGGFWKGPIGRETVKVSADPGLRMTAPTPTGLKPGHGDDNSLTWTLTNAKPTEDILLTISVEKGS